MKDHDWVLRVGRTFLGVCRGDLPSLSVCTTAAVSLAFLRGRSVLPLLRIARITPSVFSWFLISVLMSAFDLYCMLIVFSASKKTLGTILSWHRFCARLLYFLHLNV